MKAQRRARPLRMKLKRHSVKVPLSENQHSVERERLQVNSLVVILILLTKSMILKLLKTHLKNKVLQKNKNHLVQENLLESSTLQVELHKEVQVE